MVSHVRNYSEVKSPVEYSGASSRYSAQINHRNVASAR